MTTIPLINLTIDGRPIRVPKGTTVFTATKMLGIEVPIFCYQDRMPPFGACRVCLVEVEKMGKLQTSCTLEATEGMVVKTQSVPAIQGRQGILEFLLINHPLDCPICDRGGECPLQDQTLKFGPGESRFYEEKRHFTKPVQVSPVLMLDRERCIVCARCTRFGDLIAGDHALEMIDRGYRTEVGPAKGTTADSKFIGNTIQICPVGALTSDVYRFRARPWDNDVTESTCTLCPVGCSLYLDSRDGEIMRTRPREDRAVNDMWLCDKGSFGYEFSSQPERLKQPLIRRNGQLQPASWEEALKLVAEKFSAAKGEGKIAGWGGNPLTLEENYAFQELIRQGGGVNHVDHRIGSPLFSLEERGMAAGMEMDIGACEELSHFYLLGLDLTEEFPVIWLRLKQALNKGAKGIFIGHYAPEIAPHLNEIHLHAPGNEIAFLTQTLTELPTIKRGALFVGRQYLASKDRKTILSHLQKLSEKAPDWTLNLLEGRGNSFGAELAGMNPELGPGFTRIQEPGKNALQVLEIAAHEGWDYLHVAGANPAVKYASSLWKEARTHLKFLVVQDLFLTETALTADVVLPTLAFVEKEGTFVNLEGRHQKLHPGKEIPEGLKSDLEIFAEVGQRVGLLQKPTFPWPAKNSLRTQTLAHSDKQETLGGLRASFAPALFDHGVRMLHNPHVVQLAKPPRVRIHPREGSKRKILEGDTVVLNGVVSLKVHLDEKVAEGVIVIPLGFPEFSVHALGNNLLNGMQVEICLQKS